MIEIKILIEGEYRDIDLFDDEDIRMDLSVAEIQDITKKNSSFSKDFNIPGSKGNNIIFQNFYNPNSVQFSYDVRNKFPAIITYQGYNLFEGYLRLNNSVKTATEVFYNVSFYTQVGNLVANIGDKFMRELDLSHLSHPYTTTEIMPWASIDPDLVSDSNLPSLKPTSGITYWTAVNRGYSYLDTPLTGQTRIEDGNAIYTINSPRIFVNTTFTPILSFAPTIYQFSGVPITSNFSNSINPVRLNYLTPFIRHKELYEKVFEEAGYEIESEFFNTAYFKKYYLPLAFSNNFYPLQAFEPQYQFSKSGTTLLTAHTFNFCTDGSCLTANPGVGGTDYYVVPTNVIIDNFGADNGSNYSFSLGAQNDGSWNFEIQFDATNSGATSYDIIVYLINLSGGTTSTTGFSQWNSATTIPINTSGQTITLNAAFTIDGAATLSLSNNFIVNLYASQTINGTTRKIENFSLRVVNTETSIRVIDGNFDYNLEFPEQEIKQIEYIQSINKLFNLVVVPKPNTSNVLIVEPVIDYFHTGQVLDWTNKVDRNKPIQISPPTTFLEGTLEFNYNSNADWGNETFEKKYGRKFGSYKKQLNQEYKDKIIQIATIFSSEVDYSVGVITNEDVNITQPIYYQTEDVDYNGVPATEFSPIKVQPQLFYRGVNLPTLQFGSYFISLPPGLGSITAFTNTSWFFNSGGQVGSSGLTNTTQFYSYGQNHRFTTYPYGVSGFSHYTNFRKQDIFDPQELDFTCYEDLYDIYYSDYIEDLIDENARLISCSVFLEPFEIKQIQFNERIFIDGEYYRLNKIENYSLLKRDVVQSELVKITRSYRPHRVRYYDLINCTGGTDLHTSTDLNASIYAYVGKHIKTSGICYEIQTGVYNPSYTYKRITNDIFYRQISRTNQPFAWSAQEPVFDTCAECFTATTANTSYTNLPDMDFYQEIECPIIPSTPRPSLSPTATPTRTPTPTPTFLPCNCVEVSIFNDSEVEERIIYVDCGGAVQQELVPAFGFFVDCMCDDSWQIGPRMTATILGNCPGTTPTPTPSITASPTPSNTNPPPSASPTRTPTRTPTPTPTPTEFYYFIREVVNCSTGQVSGPTYVAKSLVSLPIGTYVNMDTLLSSNCAWKITSATIGPEDDIISGSCGTSLPVGCCC